jgi:Eukaryotic translation initiation factor 4G1
MTTNFSNDVTYGYDRDFLMQFISICKEKPDMLPPLDAVGLKPSDQAFAMSRDGSGRHRQSSGTAPPPRQISFSLNFNTSHNSVVLLLWLHQEQRGQANRWWATFQIVSPQLLTGGFRASPQEKAAQDKE